MLAAGAAAVTASTYYGRDRRDSHTVGRIYLHFGATSSASWSEWLISARPFPVQLFIDVVARETKCVSVCVCIELFHLIFTWLASRLHCCLLLNLTTGWSDCQLLLHRLAGPTGQPFQWYRHWCINRCCACRWLRKTSQSEGATGQFLHKLCRWGLLLGYKVGVIPLCDSS